MEPGTIAVYGRTKIGKTVDVHRCFSRAVVLETERGACTSVGRYLGRMPPRIPCLSVEDPYGEMLSVIDGPLPRAIEKTRATAVVLDTGTDLADRIFAVKDEEWNHQGMLVYPQTATLFKTVLRKLLALDVWVIALFHERRPKAIQGRYSRGGPKLPGSLVEDTPGMFDMILHATVEAESADVDDLGAGTAKVRRVYRCDGLDSEWVCGDRFAAAEPVQAMDLRPILYRITKGAEPPESALRAWGLI